MWRYIPLLTFSDFVLSLNFLVYIVWRSNCHVPSWGEYQFHTVCAGTVHCRPHNTISFFVPYLSFFILPSPRLFLLPTLPSLPLLSPSLYTTHAGHGTGCRRRSASHRSPFHHLRTACCQSRRAHQQSERARSVARQSAALLRILRWSH